MSYEIIAIIIGPLVAVFTVFLEYVKDKKEKLQDRKDMWLSKHYQELYDEFTNFSDFIIPQTSIEDIPFVDIPVIEGYFNTLTTDLISYDFKLSTFEIKLKVRLNDSDVGEKYKLVLSHLRTGYSNISNEIEELWKAENEYKNLLFDTSNEMVKRTMELMEHNFPDKTPLEENKYKGYNLEQMLNILLYSIKNNIENLVFDESQNIIYPEIGKKLGNVPSWKKQEITQFTTEEFNKFKDNVWMKLKSEFKGKIETLYGNKKSLSDKEYKLKKSIKDIIDKYKSGHAIEGYCDICEKIYHETDIKKLRPKV